MKEEIERYIELAMFLRDPNNANASEEVIDNVLDEMDALWYAMDVLDHAEIDRLIKELS